MNKFMKKIPSTPDRCRILLDEWRNNLYLSSFEETQLAKELKALDDQLERLMKSSLRVAVFGRVGVGKSSLLNALIGHNFFNTDVAHGSTKQTISVKWKQSIANLNEVEFVDTPGINEVGAEERSKLAANVATNSDLILFTLDSDLTTSELEVLKSLLNQSKPLLLVINRCDQWSVNEQKEIIRSIRARLPVHAKKLEIQIVAAAPRKAELLPDGRVRSTPCNPIIAPLKESLITLLNDQGELLLALNALRQSEHFFHIVKEVRLRRSKKAAQAVIGRFAVVKASGIVANPICLLDLAGGIAFDTALVLKLSKIYGLQMRGNSARRLLKKVSIYNSLLGGAQISIQLALGIFRNLLILATPLTGGLSLAPTAPIALIQGALAVHTTRLTGRLTAEALLLGYQKNAIPPEALMQRLIKSDPEVRRWANSWPTRRRNKLINLQALLP